MILIGMFDSPFVRRVAVSMKLLEIPFEHRNWSVGKDQDEIRKYNPLGRVPTLVLGDGEVLVESAAILDYLDERVGPERALLPTNGETRRKTLKLMVVATGAAEKGVAQVYERVFRPEEKRHEPWVERCSEQMHGALAELDRACGPVTDGHWLVGERLTQADITVTAAFTFLSETLNLRAERYPALARHVARCEVLREFQATHVPFFAPKAASDKQNTTA
ncbi:MAG: glutathione S-transferase family protein [Nevskiales bacterium]